MKPLPSSLRYYLLTLILASAGHRLSQLGHSPRSTIGSHRRQLSLLGFGLIHFEQMLPVRRRRRVVSGGVPQIYVLDILVEKTFFVIFIKLFIFKVDDELRYLCTSCAHDLFEYGKSQFGESKPIEKVDTSPFVWSKAIEELLIVVLIPEIKAAIKILVSHRNMNI